MEVRAKLLDAPEVVDSHEDVAPIKIEHVNCSGYSKNNGDKRKSSYKPNIKVYNPHKAQHKGPPRLYDRYGNPVCGHCLNYIELLNVDSTTTINVVKILNNNGTIFAR